MKPFRIVGDPQGLNLEPYLQPPHRMSRGFGTGTVDFGTRSSSYAGGSYAAVGSA